MGVPAKYEGFSDDSKQHLDTPEEQVEAERKAPGYAGCQGGRTKYDKILMTHFIPGSCE